jgi:hypothetical protein
MPHAIAELAPGETLSLEGEWDFAYRPAFDAARDDLPCEADYVARLQAPGAWDDPREALRTALEQRVAALDLSRTDKAFDKNAELPPA